MSDPVSNAEIEDVLSSIRRLVSVDHRGEARLGVKIERQDQVSHEDDQDIENDASLDDEVDPTDTPDVSVYAEEDDAPEETTKGIELGTTGVKLVLTPALRVNEAESEEEALDADVEDEADDNADVSPDDQQHAEHDFDDQDEHEVLGEGDDPLKAPEEGSDFVRLRPEAKKGWVTGEEGADAIPKAPLTDEDTWPEDELQDDSLDAELDAMSVADEAEDWTEEDLENDTSNSEPERREELVESELEARIAEVEAAVAARTEQWDPDSAEQDDYAGGEVEPLPWEDQEVAAEEKVEEVSPEEVEAIEEAIVLDEPVEPAADAFAEAMSEAAFMPSEGPASAQEPLNLADVALTDDVTEIVSDAVTESAAEAATDAAWYSEDTVIDEDTLRDLVSEIVRQELQGALGERITRNVRKLVRREIHRAMMGQDYE